MGPMMMKVAEMIYSGVQRFTLLCVLCLMLLPQIASADHSAVCEVNVATFDTHAAMDHSDHLAQNDDASAGSSQCSGMICSAVAASTSVSMIALFEMPRDVFLTTDVSQSSGIDPTHSPKPPKTT